MTDALHPMARPLLRNLTLSPPVRDHRRGVTERLFTNHHFEAACSAYPKALIPELQKTFASIVGAPGLGADHVLFTAGSMAAIDTLIQAFCEPYQESICVTTPTFPGYAVHAAMQGVGVHRVPLLGDAFDTLDVAGMLAADSKVTFICNPNSPIGNVLPLDQIETVCREARGLVVIDEAYIDFALVHSAARWVAEHDNVVVLRTFSKAWGLAGMRAGAVLAAPSVIRAMRLLLDPFAFATPAQLAVAERMEHANDVQRTVRVMDAERNRVVERLSECRSVQRIYPSQTSFLCVAMHDHAAAVRACIDQQILASNSASEVQGTLRLTIALTEENDRAIETLGKLES